MNQTTNHLGIYDLKTSITWDYYYNYVYIAKREWMKKSIVFKIVSHFASLQIYHFNYTNANVVIIMFYHFIIQKFYDNNNNDDDDRGGVY